MTASAFPPSGCDSRLRLAHAPLGETIPRGQQDGGHVFARSSQPVGKVWRRKDNRVTRVARHADTFAVLAWRVAHEYANHQHWQ